VHCNQTENAFSNSALYRLVLACATELGSKWVAMGSIFVLTSTERSRLLFSL